MRRPNRQHNRPDFTDDWWGYEKMGHAIQSARTFLRVVDGSHTKVLSDSPYMQVIKKGRAFQQSDEFAHVRSQAQAIYDRLFEVAKSTIKLQQEEWIPVDRMHELTHLCEMLEVVKDGDGYYTRRIFEEMGLFDYENPNEGILHEQSGFRFLAYHHVLMRGEERELQQSGRFAPHKKKHVSYGVSLGIQFPEGGEQDWSSFSHPGFRPGMTQQKQLRRARRYVMNKPQHRDGELLDFEHPEVQRMLTGLQWRDRTIANYSQQQGRGVVEDWQVESREQIFWYTYTGGFEGGPTMLHRERDPITARRVPEISVPGFEDVSGEVASIPAQLQYEEVQRRVVESIQNALLQRSVKKKRHATRVSQSRRPRPYVTEIRNRSGFTDELHLKKARNLARYLRQPKHGHECCSFGDVIAADLKGAEVRFVNPKQWLSDTQLVLENRDSKVLVEVGKPLRLNVGGGHGVIDVMVTGLEAVPKVKIEEHHVHAAGVKDYALFMQGMDQLRGRPIRPDEFLTFIYFKRIKGNEEPISQQDTTGYIEPVRTRSKWEQAEEDVLMRHAPDEYLRYFDEYDD